MAPRRRRRPQPHLLLPPQLLQQKLLQQLETMSADELLRLADVRGRLRRAVRTVDTSESGEGDQAVAESLD